MAAFTLSTSVSRRAMLAGSAAAVAAPAVALPAPAAVPAAGSADPDARLLRRIAVAERRRNQHARIRRMLDRPYDTMLTHPDFPNLPGLSDNSRRWNAARHSGQREAMLRYADLFQRYAAAVRGAVGTPARSLRGVQVKLGLARIAARPGDARVYLYEDHKWLDAALRDLEWLAGSGWPGAEAKP